MKITLAIPPSPGGDRIIRMIDCSHEAKANYLWQPNDMMIITSRLRPDDSAVFVDGTADSLSDTQYERSLDDADGDLVIVALSSVCWVSDYTYFRKVRSQLPSVPLYVLGDIFLEEAYQRLILNECDGIIFNPYILDLPLMQMARTSGGLDALPGVCTRPGQKIFDGKKPLFVTSGIPRHELFRKKGYRFPFARHFRFATVTTMWGCPFICTYCTDSNFPPVVRSYHDILPELDCIADLGIREIFFADKAFGFFRQNTTPLLENMARSTRFGWSCYFHPQLYDPEFLDLMRAAGCHTVITGIDSANVSSLQQYRRRVDKQRLEQFIGHASRIGMDICGDFILGLAHETEDDIFRTIQYAVDLPIDFASFNIAAPLPGSDIRERLNALGVLQFGSEGFDTCGRSGILGNENISSEALQMLRGQAFRRFYLRPSYLLRRLKRTVSLEHFLIQLTEMLVMIRKV